MRPEDRDEGCQPHKDHNLNLVSQTEYYFTFFHLCEIKICKTKTLTFYVNISLLFSSAHIHVERVLNIVEFIAKGLTAMDGQTRILYLMDVMRQKNQRR